MASWKSLLVAYLVGGITFIPLAIIAILAIGFYSLPDRSHVDPSHTSEADLLVLPGDDTSDLDAVKKANKDGTNPRVNNDLDVAAGYFAVCREYTPMGINAKPIERSTPVGSTTVASPSPSVYQTMYRSIFERKPTPGPLDNGANNTSVSQRPKKAGNIFYVVLRHGHLMLFDDEDQAEVRHVVSLAHHDVSIYSGGGKTLEGELFIKRNALCLTRRQNSPDLGPDHQVSKPFYLFSENCSAKEDFYFSLLKNQALTFGADKNGTNSKSPTPLQFDVKYIISLVQKLHSTEDNIHSRWVNALLGRVFLGIYKTRDLENFIREKLTTKISRVKRPSFLTNITIQEVYTGESAPYFTNLKLKDLTVEGECVVEADVKYTGNFRIEVAATVKIDLGTRFKAREVNLVLAVVLKRAEGHMLFKIKPPPSNRVWFAFQTMPKMEMAIEPIVSSRQITYTVILRQIENRIKEVVAETFVLPFWDDLPFFKTEHKNWRGGIFEGDDATVPTEDAETAAAQAGDVAAVHQLDENPDVIEETRPMEKSYTIPVMEAQPAPTGLFGRKLGKSPISVSASASSTSVDSKGTNSSPALSPNITRKATEPIVGTDAAHADIFKPSSSPPDHATNYMAALHSRSQDASPRPATADPPTRPSSLLHNSSSGSSSSSSSTREALDGDDANRTPIATGRRNTTSSAGSNTFSDERGPASPAPSTKESLISQTGSLGRNFFMRRENSEMSVSDASANSDASQKRNTLAAVTNAAAQARQWGWNAIQRQKEARRQAEQANHVDLSQPMGRGQPLPPPGTPLPRPTNGTTKISAPVPISAKRPGSSQPSAHNSAESLESHYENRPPTLSSMPPRRRRGQSHDFGTMPEVIEGQNILIVAAPNDSQPNTPLTETHASMPSWPEEASDGQTLADSEASQRVLNQPDDLSITGKDKGGSNSPAEDFLASTTTPNNDDDDDDDDYSGWMENDVLEVETKEPIPAPMLQEVN
ncbi:hypothetical protein B0J13DRAFT_520564 [Dactylonectria estremocensis]|uniref:SMP-LTD domain-containing protein n=1 Tax=Dactylonectria estremocensis TaxID=1079267 RepID=A0A9P9J9Z2_9HYPO|nr:hypothetical protein B0J13DRAFT_520564 [Dactylonectria estremocensis]